MSLDNFQLPPFLAAELYKDSLVDLDSKQLIPESLQEPKLNFLGNNSKNILIIVNESNAVYLPESDLNLLIDIITACKLSLSDIALVNFHKNPNIDYKMLLAYFKPTRIICLGVDIKMLAFPLEFPEYQVQAYNNQTYLSAPSLSVLAANKQEKLQLWNCLRKVFSI